MAPPANAAVIGIGELGSVFARGLLRSGVVVHPVTRGQPICETLHATTELRLVLVAVGEAELRGVLAEIPGELRHLVALVQNELVPADWQQAGYTEVSGVVVWFEKKPGREVHQVLPSLAYGPKAHLLLEAMRSLAISATALAPENLACELALKNLYILVHNLAGLVYPETVAALWQRYPDFMRSLTLDVLRHQEARLGRALDRERLVEQLRAAVRADPEHGAAGRTATARLVRVRQQARQLGLELPMLEQIGVAR